MPSGWRSSKADRGAYTSLSQTEEAGVELTAVGRSSMESKPTDPFAGNSEEKQDADDVESTASQPFLDGEDITPEENARLRRVSDKLPWSAFLVAIVELCERFAYYGLSGPFQNYMSNKWHDPNGLPGAIGLNQSGATALSNFFQFWCYVTPLFGAIIADQYLGKYHTIVYFSIIYMFGILILFLTSLPVSIEHGFAFWGLIAAMFTIGLGTGGIKANVSPLIAEQYRTTKPFVKILKSGERVIVDPAITVSRIYMIFYMCINVGSLSAVATTNLELHVGFWSAYLLPLIMFCIGFFLLVWGKRRYVIRPPQGGVIANCFRASWIAIKSGGNLEAAKPSHQEEFGARRSKTPWDDRFIDELRKALGACKVFAFFPIYWVVYSQMMNNFVSQAGQMQLHSIPNDLLQNIDPITIIALIPLLDRLIYPFLRSHLRIPFNAVTRITLGFLLASTAMLYAALVQYRIYTSPPCFDHPSACPAASIKDSNGIPTGRFKPNEISVFWQAPAYVLVALSECLASITGLEFAYKEAPEGMKSFIMSLFLLTSAVGSLGALGLSPFATDPHLTSLYVGLGVFCAGGGAAFWWTFRGMREDGDGRAREV